MRIGHKVSESIHFAALAVWLGSLVMAGAVAAQVFPLIKALDARVPDHGGFTGDQWLIVAGRVGDMVFKTTDIIQFLAVLIAVLTLAASIGLYGLSAKRIPTVVRSVALGVGLLFVAYQLLLLGPAMQQDLQAYWAAAQIGDNDAAQLHRQAFDERHPSATRALAGTSLAALCAIIAGVWSICGHRPTELASGE